MAVGDNVLFRPKAYPIRNPLDKDRKHGAIVNPPRTARLGGLDQLKEPYGHYKNDMNLQKPGGTKSPGKR